MKQIDGDRILNIRTAGEQKGFNASSHLHRYEATPYEALDRLFAEGGLEEGRFVDFGCGKGRVSLYAHYRLGVPVTGIEFNEPYYIEAERNKQRLKSKKAQDGVEFIHSKAEEYQVQPADRLFYFFNPFSVQIFMKVIGKILLSAEQFPRTITLILFYPDPDYSLYLEEKTAFILDKEIRLEGWDRDSRECFRIYTLCL